MNKLWIGKEKEGNLKDINTLFVGSKDVITKDIVDVLKKHTDIKQIYFGAGGLTEINQDVVKDIISQNKEMIITLEMTADSIPLFDKKLLMKVYLMITINKDAFVNLKHLDHEMYQVKLQSGNRFIGVCEINDVVNTKELKGNIYEGDIIVQ